MVQVRSQKRGLPPCFVLFKTGERRHVEAQLTALCRVIEQNVQSALSRKSLAHLATFKTGPEAFEERKAPC